MSGSVRDDRPLIVGAGLGGLLCALELAPMPCTLLSRGALGAEGSSGWAQGGLAAAMGADDSVTLHAADTIAAGDGFCDPAAVDAIIGAGPAVVALLERHGVRFDRRPDGSLSLGLEAAHGRHRIVHAEGDQTGAAIMRALAASVRATPSIAVIERGTLRELLRDADGVCGAVIERDGVRQVLRTGTVVLATGGIGGLFRDTTNPLGSVGSGLAAAARIGAVLRDLEFVQFHPTALAAGTGVAAAPMSLVSEAVRGEGASLIDERGERFTAELAPRDVVSRAVWRHLAAGHSVFLDAREVLGARFATRFPGIDALCRARGIDPATMPIPVRPAAHYHMGGIAVDAQGRASVPGLFAIGECACTGLHGANRLASNSLLEAAAGAVAVARTLASASFRAGGNAEPERRGGGGDLAAVRAAMSRDAGVERDGTGLERLVAALAPVAASDDAALVGLLLGVSAHRRRESRGGHCRLDHPGRAGDPGPRALTLAEADAYAASLGGAERRLAS